MHAPLLLTSSLAHRLSACLLGSLPSFQRFFGVLIESTAGDFPFWIAPIQLRLLPVSDDFRPYCEEVYAAAKAAGVRVEIDQGGRSVSKQIKVANQDKVPLYAVIGEKEIAGASLSLMCRKDGGLIDLGAIPYKEAVAKMELASKSGANAIDVMLLGDDAAADGEQHVGDPIDV